jgi:hydrogenase nickel incorporation protein HypA/HybF
MHELAITESLVDCVCENVGQARVLRVAIEIGKRSAVSAEAVRGCFEVCARGTALEGAVLEIVEPAGEELRITEVEVV